MKKLYFLFFILLFSAYCFVHAKPVDTLTTHVLEFVRNDGQWHSNVRYAARLHGGTMFAEDISFTFALLSPEQLHRFYDNKFDGKSQSLIDAAAYRMSFVGASSSSHILPSDSYDHYHNYYLGSDPAHWASRVPLFHTLNYQDLYGGVDLRISQYEHSLKYEFHIAPFADPSQILIQYEGTSSLKLSNGHLIIGLDVTRIVELPPFAYQIGRNGDTLQVHCSYQLEKNQVSFRLGDYDHSLPLVIDPVVVFSSYSGSASDNWGYTATYDSEGNLFGGGICFGVSYPTTLGAYQVNYAGGQTDISISKFNAIGNNLIYSTYIGGAALDIPHSLYVNDNDELYVLGTTGSSNYPVTVNAFDTSFNGGPNTNLSTSLAFGQGSDIVISKFSADGDELLASTFVGGSMNDGINIATVLRKNYADDNRGEILIDENSNVLVVSSTYSPDFPVTSGAYDTTYNGMQDVCVFKMNQDLSQMIWCTYLGGADNDAGYSMALASDNSVYVCGGTLSADFPTTADAYQPALAGSADGFVAHISENGSQLRHSTYLGKSDYDQCYLVKVDRQNHPHLFGQTNASGNAWIQNAQYAVPGAGQFLTKLTTSLDSVIWSTAFGTGNAGPDISPTALMVDYCSNIYMSGWGGLPLNGFGGTSGLPITNDAFQSFTDGSDFYFICISDDASQLKYASFFGGTTVASAREHVDGGTSRFDRKGRIYQAVCAGCGGQSDFPTTNGAWSNENGSSNCNLGVIKMDFGLPEVVADFSMPRTVCAPDSVHFTDHSQTIGSSTSYFWDFGDGTTSNEYSPVHFYGQAGVYVVTLVVQDMGSCNFADTLRKSLLVLTNTLDTLPDLSVCAGEFVQIGLQPFANTQYHWFPNPDIHNEQISNPVIMPSQTSVYSLEVSFGACVDTLQQRVQVHPLPATAMPDTVICAGDEAMLRVDLTDPSASVSIEWSLTPDFSTIFAQGQTQVSVSPTANTTYYVRVADDFCEMEGAVRVDVSDIHILEHPDLLICFEEGGTLTVEHDGGSGCQYHWELGDGSVYDGDQPYVTPALTTTYAVTVTNMYGCSASVEGDIIKRMGTFPTPLEAWCWLCVIDQMDTTTIFATDYGPDYVYQWSPTESLQTPDVPSSLAWPLNTTTYTIRVTDTFQCSKMATITIDVVKLTCNDTFVFIPNAFSPNADGHNDKLFVRSAILDEFYFVVYNHWGEKVFETVDLKSGWDGNFRGKECPNGVYDYYFRGVCIEGETLEKRGNVMLIR